MTTKLEAMVGYLAGRDGNPSLLDELADPSSEASRFLEATRTRSRALLDRVPVVDPLVEPLSRRPKSRNWFERLAWASLGLMALGATIWAGEVRSRRLEATLERASAEDRARSEQIESALESLASSTASAEDTAGQIQAALGQVAARVDQLDRQVQSLVNRPEPTPKPDPTLAEVRDQLAMLRRELSSGEKTSLRRADELHAAINEVSRLLRLLVKGSQPDIPTNEVPPRRIP